MPARVAGLHDLVRGAGRPHLDETPDPGILFRLWENFGRSSTGERRPAVTNGSSAFDVLAPDQGWVPVSPAEVDDSGSVLAEPTFRARFGSLPTLPSSASQAGPDLLSAAE